MPNSTSMLTDQTVADELLRCNRCGYCMSTCPTYRARRDERYVARGRNELVRATLSGEMACGEELRDPLFQCLLCGACTEACFTRVKTDEIMVAAREAWYGAHGRPAVQRLIFHGLLPYPERLTRVMRLLSLGKRSGLSEVAHRLGLLRWIHATLEGADGLVATMPRRFLRDRLRSMGFVRQTGEGVMRRVPDRQASARHDAPTVVFFVGCGTNYQLPRQGEAALRLLALAGCQLTVLPNVCCGLPPYSYGDRGAARRLARRNLALLAAVPADWVVTECGSCSGFLKRWPALLREDDMAPQAEAVALKVRDVTEALTELGLPPPPSPLGATVTYHDPCHLRRTQGIVEQPRRLLRDAAGAKLIELAEADWCCGGAGSYNLAQPELSLQILHRKLCRIAETAAEVVATACPACVIQLSYGVRRGGSGPLVRHVAELVAEAQGLPLGD